ncbi:MAG: hypothetical protein LIO62_05915 [Clostridiales bacterium]|nr:hypothetical protein [Clostridiales bacterium]
MTLQKYSANKKSARYDFKHSLKSLIFPSVLSFLIACMFFIYKPFEILRTYFTVRETRAEALAATRENFVCVLTGISHYSDTQLCVGIFAIITGVLFAIFSYSFLMRKKTVNFYFSTALDRKTMFKNRTLSSIVMMALSAFVPILIDVFMNIYYLAHPSYMILGGLILFVAYFAYMLIGFALMSVSMIICSTFIESTAFCAGLTLTPTVLVCSADAMANCFLRGYNRASIFSSDTFDSRSLVNITSNFNPLFFSKAIGNYDISDNVFSFLFRGSKTQSDALWYGFGGYDYESVPINYIAPVLIWLAVSVLVLFVAEKLFIKRKVENAGIHGLSTFASRFFAVEVGIAAAALAVYLYTDIFTDLEYNISVLIAVLIAVVAIALTYAVIILINSRKIKHTLKSFIPCIAGGVSVIAVIIILSNGAFGYSTYVPPIDEIKYATISNAATNFTGGYTVNLLDNSYSQSVTQIWSNDYIGLYSDSEDLEKLESLHTLLAENPKNGDGTFVEIVYELKSGVLVSRQYNVTDAEDYAEILSLSDSSANKEELEFLLSSSRKDEEQSDLFASLDSDYFNEYIFFQNAGTYNMLTESATKQILTQGNAKLVLSDGYETQDIENTDALRDALLADLLNMDYKERFLTDEKAIGAVCFCTSDTIYEEYDDDTYYVADVIYTDGDCAVTYYIYESMTNTVNYLKSSGEYELLFDTDTKSEIVSATLKSVKNIIDDYYPNRSSNLVTSRISPIIYTTWSLSINADESQGDEFVMNNDFTNGTTVTDSEKLKEIEENSSIIYFAYPDDYLVLLEYENGDLCTRVIRNETALDFI